MEQNDTLFKLFEYSAARWHGRPMASYIDGAQAYTYGSFQEKVLKMSVLLARHHVYGGKVAILAENCPNWTVAFFASAAMGRVAVPILPASSQMEVSNILDHSEVRRWRYRTFWITPSRRPSSFQHVSCEK